MINIYNKATNEFLGHISEAELAILAANLEKESLTDTDFYIRKETVDDFEAKGVPDHLLAVIKGGLRHDNAIEIRWERGAPPK
jgi:hypothetical protein